MLYVLLSEDWQVGGMAQGDAETPARAPAGVVRAGGVGVGVTARGDAETPARAAAGVVRAGGVGRVE